MFLLAFVQTLLELFLAYDVLYKSDQLSRQFINDRSFAIDRFGQGLSQIGHAFLAESLEIFLVAFQQIVQALTAQFANGRIFIEH